LKSTQHYGSYDINHLFRNFLHNFKICPFKNTITNFYDNIARTIMTTNPSNPNPSHVQAHVMRKNAEEQSILFQDLAKWEKCMKQRDSNLRNQNEILKEENQKTEYAKTNSNVSIQREIKYDKNEYCTTSSTPPSKIRQQKTNNVKMVPQNENYQAAPSKKSSPIKVDENIQQAYHVTSNQRQVMSKEEREMQERKKGNEFYVVGKYQEAFQCYSTCLGINPKSMLAYSNRCKFIYYLFCC